MECVPTSPNIRLESFGEFPALKTGELGSSFNSGGQ